MQKLLPAITYLQNKEITTDFSVLQIVSDNQPMLPFLRIMYRISKNLKARVVTRVSKSMVKEKEVNEELENNGFTRIIKTQHLCPPNGQD